MSIEYKGISHLAEIIGYVFHSNVIMECFNYFDTDDFVRKYTFKKNNLSCSNNLFRILNKCGIPFITTGIGTKLEYTG